MSQGPCTCDCCRERFASGGPVKLGPFAILPDCGCGPLGRCLLHEGFGVSVPVMTAPPAQTETITTNVTCGCTGEKACDTHQSLRSDGAPLTGVWRDPPTRLAPHIIRSFATGATRDSAAGKHDYTGFLDPRILQRYAAFMERHRQMKDGSVREPDNWKRGMPPEETVKSLIRHAFDVWMIHEYGKSVRPEDGTEVTLDDALGGMVFNAFSYWREKTK